MTSGIQELFNMMAEQAKNAELHGNGMIGLGELHSHLMRMPPEALVAVEYCGVAVWAGDLVSYRGYYEDLSFDLSGKVTVYDTLNDMEEYFGGLPYEGYKGGEYYAHADTLVWAAAYGEASGIGVTGVELRNGTVFLTTVDTNDR